MERKQLESLMDKFVRKEISKEELKDLEIESLINPNVESELKLINDISKGIEIVGNEDLKLVLDKIHYQNFKNKDNNSQGIKWIWVCSALILFVLSLFIFKKYFAKHTVVKNNYAEYFEPYIPSLTTRGSGMQKRIKDFGEAYGQKRYERALIIIDPVLEKSNNEFILIAAICAMETHDYEKSNYLFDKIINSNDYYYLDHAKWYKALSYLKQNKNIKAISLLNELANDQNADHHNQAKNLLENI